MPSQQIGDTLSDAEIGQKMLTKFFFRFYEHNTGALNFCKGTGSQENK
jgi:hypothetical protein